MKTPAFRLTISAAACAALALAAAATAHAQEYPSRPVRLVVANVAGSPADRQSRSISKVMEPSFGQPIVVENKPGGANAVAVSEVLRSPADGYMVGHSCLASIVTMPFFVKDPPFHFVRDAGIVGVMGGLDVVIATPAGNSVNNIEDLVALAKKSKPGTVTIGMTQAVANIVPIVYMSQKAGIQLNIIGYKGQDQVLAGLFGGDVSFGIISSYAAWTQIQAGKLKAIQVLAEKRNQLLPNVPAFSDTKIPGFDPNLLCVMYAPKAVPTPIMAKLNRSLNEAGKDKELNAQFVREGLVPYIGGTLAEASNVVKDMESRWAAVVKEVDISKYR